MSRAMARMNFCRAVSPNELTVIPCSVILALTISVGGAAEGAAVVGSNVGGVVGFVGAFVAPGGDGDGFGVDPVAAVGALVVTPADVGALVGAPVIAVAAVGSLVASVGDGDGLAVGMSDG